MTTPAAAPPSLAAASRAALAALLPQVPAAELVLSEAEDNAADVLARIAAADPTVTPADLSGAEIAVLFAERWLTGRQNAVDAARAGLINDDLTAAEIVRSALLAYFEPSWVELLAVASDSEVTAPIDGQRAKLYLIQSKAAENAGGVLRDVTVQVAFFRAAGVAVLNADHLHELLTGANVSAQVDVYPGQGVGAGRDSATIRITSAVAPIPTLGAVPGEGTAQLYANNLSFHLARAVGGGERVSANDPHRKVVSAELGTPMHQEDGSQLIKLSIAFSITPKANFTVHPGRALRDVMEKCTGQMFAELGRVVSVDDLAVAAQVDRSGRAPLPNIGAGFARGDVFTSPFTVTSVLTVAYRVAAAATI